MCLNAKGRYNSGMTDPGTVTWGEMNMSIKYIWLGGCTGIWAAHIESGGDK